ncbi:MAG: two-component system response regulator [Rhodospirillaceae bacterium]|jgi:putative two-component system response regulator|nr:two-component system response regulator [Rhodospirillaceae bacterium]MBT5664126.1 two-component system response regulator [Rhodospirillaceae bacterium]MBT5809127.1 two-component system response regulator [Rhodospirillaceae bacterium]
MSKHAMTVLVVDDEAININLLVELLKDEYRTLVATNGAQALRRVQENTPDLILLDVMMPDMDGFEVCRRLQAEENAKNIPIVFVTAMGDNADEAVGLDIGAVDYIRKPFSPPVVRARVRNLLELKQARDFMMAQNEILEEKVRERTAELAQTQDATIRSLATLAEMRDNETGAHLRRTQNYIRATARHLQSHPRFKDILDDATIDLIYKSAPLHDIGKVGIPDAILLKPGKLTPEEFTTMKEHAVFGRDALLAAEEQLGSNSFLKYAKDVALTHHENWDGSGYPQGLKGDDIPVAGRLMMIADVYDALISKRVYKPAFTHEMAMEFIKEDSGKKFDPDIVTAFFEIETEIREIGKVR